ncbi:MAG TPA: VIT domain-containing protein [Vicinamibacteria bacterium]|nr:VIT domain-containing protein [Vicinamibacteria bacterium]
MATTEARPAPPRAGLLAAGQPVPLLGVNVEAEVRDFASRVVMTQRYRNAQSQPIEAVYVFPVEEGAAVSGFEAIIDGVHVVGQVREREKAFEEYDEALTAGHGAYLLDQERADVFTASIGNLPPGKEVLVRITYVAELSLEGDDLRFALPTTVSPRYAPAEDSKGVGQPPSEALNPPRDWQVPYGLDVTVRIEMPSPIRAVESPSHPVRVELDGSKAMVKLGGRETALDRDFVLKVKLAEAHVPRAWLETDPRGRRAALVVFQPRFNAEESPCELILLVDRSGSMQGTSIAEARNALQLCLRSLTEGTRFNIVGFGSTFEMLFPESRAYDERSLKEASKHVDNMEASMGGTEILASLEAILQKPPLPGVPRQVFVLTDGQVTNTGAVIKLVRKHSDTTRVFAFGIGAGASHHLVRGLVHAGSGAAEFIAPGERIEGKVLRQLSKALAPALTEVKLDWGGLRVKQAPFHVPPVFAGGRVLVYGLVEDGTPREVTLSARGPSGPVSFRVPLTGPGSAGTLIATLAARTMIRDLEEGSSPLHDRHGSLQERGQTNGVKTEMVRLGTEYELCSAHTSFVAIEKRDTPVAGEAQLRRIPIALTSGWGGVDRASIMRGSAMIGSASITGAEEGATVYFGSAPRMNARARPGTVLLSRAPAPTRKSGFLSKLFALWREGRGVSGDEAATLRPTSSRALDRLVTLQRADGAWDLTDELAKVLGVPLHELEKKLRGQRDPDHRRALGTALALLWLESNADDAETEWALLAKKARKWLERCPVHPANGNSWLEAAAVQSP